MKELLKIALTRDNGKLYVEVWEATELSDDGKSGTYRQLEHVPVSEDSVLHKELTAGGAS